ncbi:HupE/UreJ family protein [Methylocapsa aurea]|uniref:HupE/UreJ family protein n=1 Tax=Methylocapsa aurea TaxID=663610 RepID=UPI00056D39E3|nr:HupE/UreJ family protein [Methylocapsa aurea]
MNRSIAWLCTAAVLFCASIFAATRAEAHAQSYGFLRVNVGDHQVSGQLELALRDLDLILDLDANGDGKLTWGEVRQREEEIGALAEENLSIGPIEAPCKLVPEPIKIDARGGENYAIIPFTGQCGELGDRITVAYDLMFEADAQHRGLVNVTKGEQGRSNVMTPDAMSAVFDFGSESSLVVFRAFVAHGMHHIWTGYDHMLFLITLLLSAVVIRSNKRWIPVKTLSSALWATVRIVTAFTVAHSITLTAAVFNIVELPSKLVECVIAASVAIAAFNNLFPVVSRRIWVAAFVFGLMHGFGFANALTDLGLPPGGKAVALLAFNVGVELGQLAVVAAVLPILFWMRRTVFYTRVALPVGSLIIAIIAILWLIQRATDTTIIFG